MRDKGAVCAEGGRLSDMPKVVGPLSHPRGESQQAADEKEAAEKRAAEENAASEKRAAEALLDKGAACAEGGRLSDMPMVVGPLSHPRGESRQVS